MMHPADKSMTRPRPSSPDEQAFLAGYDPSSFERASVAVDVVLLAPAVWGWSSQPFIYKTALEIAAHLAPAKVFTPPAWVTG